MDIVLTFCEEDGRRSFPMIMDGICKFARIRKWHIENISSKDRQMQIDRLLDFWKPIGCIAETGPEAILPRKAFGRIPVVFFNREPFRTDGNASVVEMDHPSCVRVAVSELLGGNPVHVGFVPFLIPSRSWCRLREKAFRDCLAATQTDSSVFQPKCRTRRISRVDFIRQLRPWLRRLPRPCGILAACDDRAIQVLEACHEAKVAIPGDVAVLGVDNDEMLCANTTPPLTSIQPDHDRMGYLAAERLAEMLDGKRLRKPDHLLVGTKTIVIRESTSPVSNAGRLVQRALAYIRANATKAIKPRDVAAHLKVSRSLADLRFRELQHESIGEAIRHYRLEEVRRRLVGTNDTIENIANDCHFTKLCRLNEAFSANYGCTMGQYRKTHRSRLQTETDDGR